MSDPRRLRALSAGLLLGGAALTATLGASPVPAVTSQLVEWLMLGGGAGIVLGALWAAWRSGTRAIAREEIASHNGDEAAHPRALDRALADLRADIQDLKATAQAATEASLSVKAGHETVIRDGLCPALAQLREAREALREAREELLAGREALAGRPRRSSDPEALDDSEIRRLRLRGRQ